MAGETQRFEVRVLCRAAVPSEDDRSALLSFLTDEEEQRRRQFYHRIDADRFLVGRGTLRREVGRMLGIAPREVQLELGEHLKPEVRGGAAHVNVSHSGDVVLIALTSSAPIGVDVEQIDESFAHETLLASCFSDREIREFTSLPASTRVEAFFHTWTSREAVMKAVGLGFYLPRTSFDVSVDPHEPPALLDARTDVLTRQPITLVPITVPSGHAAMLAVAAPAGAFRVSATTVPSSCGG